MDRKQTQFTTRNLIAATIGCSILTAMWAVVLRAMGSVELIDRVILAGWVFTTNGQVLFSILVWSRISKVAIGQRRDYYTATALSLFPLSFLVFMWRNALRSQHELGAAYASFSCFMLVMLVVAIFGLFSPSRVRLREDCETICRLPACDFSCWPTF